MLTEEEIKAFLQKKEVRKFLKDNLELDLWNEACESCLGYDIFAEVRLFGKLLVKAEDCI